MRSFKEFIKLIRGDNTLWKELFKNTQTTEIKLSEIGQMQEALARELGILKLNQQNLISELKSIHTISNSLPTMELDLYSDSIMEINKLAYPENSSTFLKKILNSLFLIINGILVVLVAILIMEIMSKQLSRKNLF
jgi:hypothetical protein